MVSWAVRVSEAEPGEAQGCPAAFNRAFPNPSGRTGRAAPAQLQSRAAQLGLADFRMVLLLLHRGSQVLAMP